MHMLHQQAALILPPGGRHEFHSPSLFGLRGNRGGEPRGFDPGPGSDVSRAPGTRDRAVSARWGDRHRRPPILLELSKRLGQQFHRRERSRGERRHRHREGSEGGARRLHASLRLQLACGESLVVRQGCVRPDQGFRADHARGHLSRRALRASLVSCEDARRAGRADSGPARASTRTLREERGPSPTSPASSCACPWVLTWCTCPTTAAAPRLSP